MFRLTRLCSSSPVPTVMRGVSTILRNSGSCRRRIARLARSRALDTFPPSSPIGSAYAVSESPRRCAVRFISATKSGIDPETRSASAAAASFPDAISRP